MRHGSVNKIETLRNDAGEPDRLIMYLNRSHEKEVRNNIFLAWMFVDVDANADLVSALLIKYHYITNYDGAFRCVLQ